MKELIRIGIIDSGVNPAHPHVAPIAGGVSLTPETAGSEYLDFLGHGTAVAGAIREKAPYAELYAVKVFERSLVTTGHVLLAAIDWCLDRKMDFVNLSLGTLNAAYVPGFVERQQRADALGITIVAALEMNGQSAFPGSLPGFAGVILDEQCPRDRFLRKEHDGRILYAASGFARDIPGVPPERNLRGISFAVANVTGFLAAQEHACRQA